MSLSPRVGGEFSAEINNSEIYLIIINTFKTYYIKKVRV